MQVKAIRTGFYNNSRRVPGTKTAIFALKNEKDFRKSWMQKVDPKKGKAKQEEQPEEQLSESAEENI